jgi:predicted nucleic acid-binding protein
MVDLCADLALEAAATSVEEGLTFADSIIYAVAKRHGALLWTQDAHFAGKSGVRYRAKGRE